MINMIPATRIKAPAGVMVCFSNPYPAEAARTTPWGGSPRPAKTKDSHLLTVNRFGSRARAWAGKSVAIMWRKTLPTLITAFAAVGGADRLEAYSDKHGPFEKPEQVAAVSLSAWKEVARAKDDDYGHPVSQTFAAPNGSSAVRVVVGDSKDPTSHRISIFKPGGSEPVTSGPCPVSR